MEQDSGTAVEHLTTNITAVQNRRSGTTRRRDSNSRTSQQVNRTGSRSSEYRFLANTEQVRAWNDHFWAGRLYRAWAEQVAQRCITAKKPGLTCLRLFKTGTVAHGILNRTRASSSGNIWLLFVMGILNVERQVRARAYAVSGHYGYRVYAAGTHIEQTFKNVAILLNTGLFSAGAAG